MKTWYTIKNQGEDAANIDIFDEIGYWGISARDFINDLRGIGAVKNIKVRINSYGGAVFDGIAIYNALKRHEAKVAVEIYGVAASIASIVAMAGDTVSMPANTFLFLHNPLALVIGDADDMREEAEALDKIASALQSTYMAKSGKTEKEVKKWMSEDTWFTAQEAFDAGLADEVTDEVKMAANANLARFKNLPQPLVPLAKEPVSAAPAPAAPTVDAGAIRAEAETRAREILAACTKAGVPEAASDFLDKGLTADEVKAKLSDADKIRAKCVAAKMPDRANAYIAAGMSEKEVGNDLFAVLLARQGTEIDNHLGPESERQTTQKPKTASSAQIYELRKKKK